MDIDLKEFKLSYDWQASFACAFYGSSGYSVGEDDLASHPIDQVIEIIAMEEGENDGNNWIGIFRLKDERYIYLIAGCDYTGWGCQEGGSYIEKPTLKEILSKLVLDQDARKRLYNQLRDKYELDWDDDSVVPIEDIF